MQTTNHLDFIVASYVTAIIIIGALIAWVMLDFRAQKRKLANLESRGVTRRGGARHSERSMRRAKEKA